MLWAWHRPLATPGQSPALLFPPCRWSHVELHEDEAEMLVRILLPLPELKTFGYVSSCDLFHIFIICSILCLRPVLLVLHTRGVEISPNSLVPDVCAVRIWNRAVCLSVE